MSDLDTELGQEDILDLEDLAELEELDLESESEEETIDPLRSFVDALQGGNFNSAETMFNNILDDKVQDALDAEKISVADEIFNGVEPVEFEDEEEVWEDDDVTSEVEYGEESEGFGSSDPEEAEEEG